MINFDYIIKKLNKLNIKNSKKFFKKKKLFFELIKNNDIKKKIDDINSSQVRKKIKKKLSPNIQQLYFVFNLITIFRRVTVLEFGVGWSTIAISNALLENKKKYYSKIKNLRFNDPFRLFSVDNYKKFIRQTKNKLNKQQTNVTSFCFSRVKTVEFEKRICNYGSNCQLCGKLQCKKSHHINRDGQIQIKSNRRKNDFMSNQITHFFARCQIKSNYGSRQMLIIQVDAL